MKNKRVVEYILNICIKLYIIQLFSKKSINLLDVIYQLLENTVN
jgi:hypothetical protein